MIDVRAAYGWHSLAVRLVVAVLVVQAIFIGAIVFDLVRRDGVTLEQNRIERVRALASVLATGAARSVADHDSTAIAHLIQSIAPASSVRYVMYLDPQGRILGHTASALVGRKAVDPVTLEMLRGPAMPTLRQS